MERLDKLVVGYYGQASEGWTKFREAERTLKAAQSALAEKEREVASYKTSDKFQLTNRMLKEAAAKQAELIKQLKAAESRAAEAEKDARRYRWLRDNRNQGARSPESIGLIITTDRPSKTPRYAGPVFGKELDAIIDAAP